MPSALRGQWKVSNTLQRQLQTVVRQHLKSGNKAQVLYKSNMCCIVYILPTQSNVNDI